MSILRHILIVSAFLQLVSLPCLSMSHASEGANEDADFPPLTIRLALLSAPCSAAARIARLTSSWRPKSSECRMSRATL